MTLRHPTLRHRGRRAVAAIAVLLLAGSLAVAAGAPAVAATTSVEGNCLSTVTPLATLSDDGTNSTVTLTWTDNCTNVDFYDIERSDDGGVTWTQIASGLTFPRLTPPEQDGSYIDADLDCGTYVYRVIAVHAPGMATAKTSISLHSNAVTVTVSPNCTNTGGGGQCTQLTNALTLGYYSNKNGQATITSGDLSFLNGLVLVNASGNDTNFANKAALANWLLNATAKNMSYMISAQLATLALNILHGLVNPSAVLCDGTWAGYSIGEIANLDEGFVSNYPVVLGGDANRMLGDSLQTITNEINNDLVTVQ
jgi:hypothetical protein